MKKILSFLLPILLCLLLILPAAAAQYPRLIDEADLLSPDEETALLQVLDTVSARQGFDVVVITTYSLNGWDAEAYAEAIYDQLGYGTGTYADGVLLLISMEYHDWAMTSTGNCQDSVNASARDYIADAIIPCLSRGDYSTAFTVFAEYCDEFGSMAQRGETYQAPFNFKGALLAAILIGVIAAAISVSVMKSKLKTVRAETAAAAYIRRNSLNVTVARENFLYRQVSRVARPKDTGARSGGGGHSGHSSSHGKF